MILDASALIAADRGDRAMIARLLACYQAGDELRTHPLIVAQAWRGGAYGRQARLAKLLKGVLVVPIDNDLGRATGALLGQARTSDPIDGALVLIAKDGDAIVTSDPGDIRALVNAAGVRAVVVAC